MTLANMFAQHCKLKSVCVQILRVKMLACALQAFALQKAMLTDGGYHAIHVVDTNVLNCMTAGQAPKAASLTQIAALTLKSDAA